MYRNSIKYLLLIVLMMQSFQPALNAQARLKKDRADYNELYRFVLDKYGFDQVLANGVVYKDMYWKKEGHQFLGEDRPYAGNLVFRGKEYKGLEMKYDICNQQIIVFVKHNYLQVGIVPPDDFISTFSLEDKSFSKYDFSGEPLYYQVVFDSDKAKCLYHWSKQALETASGGNYKYYHYEFTDSKRKSYLYLNGSFELYRNNRSFRDLFPQDIKTRIWQYLKANHINVLKSSDEKMTELMTYCNSLLY